MGVVWQILAKSWFSPSAAQVFQPIVFFHLDTLDHTGLSRCALETNKQATSVTIALCHLKFLCYLWTAD
jgi:hypothetical protein